MTTTTHLVDDPCTTLHLPHRVESVGRARRSMGEELAEAGLPRELVDDAQLVLSELVSNACEHGRADAEGNIEVSWCLHDRHLRLSVVDGGRVPELEALPLSDESLRGRGLAIVDYLCERWEHDHEHGTRVTAELRLDQGA